MKTYMKYRYRVETRKPGTYLRPLTMCQSIKQATQAAVRHQAELPGGKTVIHDRVMDQYRERK